MDIDITIFFFNLCRNMFTDAYCNNIFFLCGFILSVLVVSLWLTNTPITLLHWCISSWQEMCCFSVQAFKRGSKARQVKLKLSVSVTSVSWVPTLKWKFLFFEVWGPALYILNFIPFLVLYLCRVSFLCNIVSLKCFISISTKITCEITRSAVKLILENPANIQ